MPNERRSTYKGCSITTRWTESQKMRMPRKSPTRLSRPGKSLGLGLTVVRERAEAHGGDVVASSAGSGLGSQFVGTLPLTRAPTIPQK